MAENKISTLVRKSIEKQLNDSLNGIDNLILINYTGLSASELSMLRDKLVINKARLFVVKNSLSRRVLKDRIIGNLNSFIDGPTGIIFVQDDAATTSKVLVDFAKEHKALALRAGFIKDKVLNKDDLEELSRLPSREILRAKVVYAFKAPLNNLANTLNQILSKPVWVLKAILDKKQNQQ